MERSRHRYPPRLSVSSRRFTLPGTSSSKSVSPPTDSPTPLLLLAIPPTRGSARSSSTPHAAPLLSFPSSSSSFGRISGPPAATTVLRRHNSWSGNSWNSAGDGQRSRSVECLFQ
uniref:Uncharacterized protein n=1 Tax=Setaria viridis TaxID=4556 RepID=A0A4U6W389_SETVI|nr:hypothetical protein SEVIR_2G137901v2 [Setaria viridis]